MIKILIRNSLIALGLMISAHSVHAVPVDVELILATDVSGSVDNIDFALRRDGIEAAFRSVAVIDAIESGAIGSIAVTLWDFASDVAVAVDWMLISSAADSNAFADAVSTAARSNLGCCDGQSNLITIADGSLGNNGFEGREILDINSEGAQDIDGCQFNNNDCIPTQNARDAFLAGGDRAINAIWMNDRDFFGLDPTDIINAFDYGNTNVIGGDGSFQVFAETNADFVAAIEGKIIREITGGVPEPSILVLLGIGLAGFGFARRKKA